MRGQPGEAGDDAQRPVAPSLHLRTRGLAEKREVAVEPLGVAAVDAPQAVEVSGHLLVVVEDPRDVGAQRGLVAGTQDGADLARERKRRRTASEHVHRAAPPQNLDTVAFFSAAGNVVGDGDRVQVPREDKTLAPSQPGARTHRVAVAQDLQGRDRAEARVA